MQLEVDGGELLGRNGTGLRVRQPGQMHRTWSRNIGIMRLAVPVLKVLLHSVLEVQLCGRGQQLQTQVGPFVRNFVPNEGDYVSGI